MSAETKYFKLGMFVLIGVAVAVAAVVVWGAGTFMRTKVMAETYVDESVQGLDVGSAVKFRGVHVGQLEKIEFAGIHYKSNDKRIRLIIAFFPEPLGVFATEDPLGRLSEMISEGLRVRLASAGLTGGLYLELDTFDPKLNPASVIPWQAELPYLPSIPSTNTRMMTRIENVLGHVEKMRVDVISDKIVALVETLDKTVKSLQPAVEDVRKFTEEATLLARDTRKVFAEDVGKELRAMVVQIRETLEKDVGPALKGIRTATDHLPGTFDKIDGTLDRLGGTLKRMDRTLAEGGGSLDEALDNLRAVTQDLHDLTSQVKKYPSQALFGEAPPKKAVNK